MEQARELRAALNRERRAGRGKGKQGFSAGLRQRVVEFLRRERANGRRVDDLVAALGLSRPTVYAWVGAKAAPQPAFRQLTIVPKRRGRATTDDVHRKADCGVVVMGPGGVAVRGMSVGDVAELLRRLGC